MPSPILGNINEILYGWDVVGYMQSQARRYARRRHFWALSAPAADERLRPWERLDRVLMTNQLWLVLMLYGAGGSIVVLGYMLMLHQTVNMFTDPMFLPLIWIVRLAYVAARAIFARAFKWIVQPRMSQQAAPGPRGTWRV